MSEETVEVLPGQMSIEDTDTAVPEVHYGAVNEFDALPEGYAKVIQPMREHNEAEDAALQESVRLFGFIGTIVRDQYGRILDGNQRARVARLFGTGCPFTIFHVRDDAHAIEVATQLNLARRHMYTPEQRQQIALALREKGESYRYIAAALGVSKDTVQRDIFGGFKIIASAEPESVSPETPDPAIDDMGVSPETPDPVSDDLLVSHETPAPEKRIRGRDGKLYPDRQPQRSNGTKAKTSPADKQLAQVINLLMTHVHQWDEKHWQAFMDVVQNLRPTSHTAGVSDSEE